MASLSPGQRPRAGGVDFLRSGPGRDHCADADDLHGGDLGKAGFAQPEQILLQAAWLIAALFAGGVVFGVRGSLVLLGVELRAKRIPDAAIDGKERGRCQPDAVREQEEAAGGQRGAQPRVEEVLIAHCTRLGQLYREMQRRLGPGIALPMLIWELRVLRHRGSRVVAPLVWGVAGAGG